MMATPLRTCVRCQLDILQAAGKRRSNQPITNVRRQYPRLPSQLVSRRAYSDDATNDATNGSTPTPRPQITIEQIADQLGVPKPRFITQAQPRHPGAPISGTVQLPEPELTDEEFQKQYPGLGSLTPWTFPLDDSFKTIDSLGHHHIDTTIKLRGWFYSGKSANKDIAFATILQGGKLIQATFDRNAGFKGPHTVLATRSHTPVEIEGVLKYKPQKREHTGQPNTPDSPKYAEEFHRNLEVIVSRYESIGDPPKNPIIAGTVHGGDSRYLSMRTSPDLLKALHMRNQVSQICRKHLDEEGFLEVETPLLFKSTPEGAREFLVPTRTPGQMYALPQSPQQYKQILMAGGILKYFQIAKCFRDEDLRADRQPEFTQLDLEMGFTDGVTVQKTVERLLKRIWYEVLGEKLPEFRVMSYHVAINNYGTDKPDTRYGMVIRPFEKIIEQHAPIARTPVHGDWKYEIISHPSYISNSRLGVIASQIASPTEGDFAPLRGPDPDCIMFKIGAEHDHNALRKQLLRIAPHLEEDPLALERIIGAMISKTYFPINSIIVIGRRKKEFNPGGSTNLGQLRKILCSKLIQHGYMEKLVGWKFLWVTHFPLFTPVDPSDNEPGQSGTAGYKSTHHPFTAPTISTRENLLTSPWKTLGHHYDIVLNGVELGGGSTRIHEAELQRSILEDVLKVPPEKMKTFKHLIEMLETGCPPHAGLAIGFDRLIAILAGRESIREVIAFPKNNRGQDLVVDSPGPVSEKQLEEYGIMLKEKALEDREEPVPRVEDESEAEELVKDFETRVVKEEVENTEVAAPAVESAEVEDAMPISNEEVAVAPKVEDVAVTEPSPKVAVHRKFSELLQKVDELKEKARTQREEETAEAKESQPVEDLPSTLEPSTEIQEETVAENEKGGMEEKTTDRTLEVEADKPVETKIEESAKEDDEELADKDAAKEVNSEGDKITDNEKKAE
ncbi:hypothetical protein TWF281_010371 [Arthrobotrys megalospora]